MSDIDKLCEVMHNAYEAAAPAAGWQTQERSRKPWADVPEANKATMRAAVAALLDQGNGADPMTARDDLHQQTREQLDAIYAVVEASYEGHADDEPYYFSDPEGTLAQVWELLNPEGDER